MAMLCCVSKHFFYTHSFPLTITTELITFSLFHITLLYINLLVLPNIRDGILVHTGNWTTEEVTWRPTMDMPNSAGCIHAHPSDVERIYTILTQQLGVQVRDNPFSGKNYPYQPQGVGVIERID